VPIFADPIEWDIHRSYESLTIVTHDGESYTSKCNVGPGIDITNERYWAKTGAYNAQVEQYKNEVKDLSSQVSGFASDNAEFREKIDQFTKDNAEMKNTVAEDKARVDALAERVATAETEIDGLQATTAQHTTEIADLHAKDEDLQRQITSNDGDIAALQAKDTEQDSRLTGIDTKLKSHDASIAQNTADIAKNTKNIQDNAANIAKNAHELADHAAKLADHEGRLTAQHEEITANHQAIERLTSVTDGLRSDLTEDEAKIESNRDAIAHIQEKDVQQDGRLDKLEECCEQAKAHFTQLDTKTDNTNTALTAEIDRAKAAELANGHLIAKNAAELATHATELADHETRISTLESDNTTSKQDIADIKAKNAQQDTAISGNTDSITHLETDKADKTALGDYVTKTEFNADQKRQDDIVGDWATAHPGQTISECATSQENELAEHAASIAKLITDKVAIDRLFPISVNFPRVEIIGMNPGITSDETGSVLISDITLPFLRKESTSAPATVTVNSTSVVDVFYFDGNTGAYHVNTVSVSGNFGAGYVHLQVRTTIEDIPAIAVAKPFVIRVVLSVTVSTTGYLKQPVS
jgi:chromosome segregation ATPase